MPAAVPEIGRASVCSAAFRTSSVDTAAIDSEALVSTVNMRLAEAGLPALSLTEARTWYPPSSIAATSEVGTLSVHALPDTVAV